METKGGELEGGVPMPDAPAGPAHVSCERLGLLPVLPACASMTPSGGICGSMRAPGAALAGLAVALRVTLRSMPPPSSLVSGDVRGGVSDSSGGVSDSVGTAGEGAGAVGQCAGVETGVRSSFPSAPRGCSTEAILSLPVE